jgi:cysteinyl-tRNA synthetase
VKSLSLTNTLTGRKELFQPLDPPRVSLYVCGVTVYDDCHVGHLRGAVVFDVLRRYLETLGFQVTHVRNITDVDDKIIDRTREELKGQPESDLKAAVQGLARRFEASFRSDFEKLNLLPPHQEPRATEFIDRMVAFIAELLTRGAAYVGTDGVYFSVRKIEKFGALSHQRLEEMRQGVRVEAGEGKRDPLDFALWKRSKPEEPSWASPWGPGRPGWHIECSTMSTVLLGDAFDIHGGGQDLIFPHHENELAQALGAGKPFAKVWLHHGLLTVNGQKMSKSLGNVVRISDALGRHSPDVLRLFFLSAHYRSPLDFTWGRLEEAAAAYERFAAFLARADALGKGPETPLLSDKVEDTQNSFLEAMEDDLNTPRALASLFELIGYANDNHWFDNALMQDTVRAAGGKIRKLGRVLGFFQSEVLPAADAQVQRLVKERDQARAQKDFAASDRIRKELTDRGYVVEDTTAGTVIRRKP